MAKIVIALNTAWNLVNFRAGLIRVLVDRGHEVVAVAPYDDYAPRLAALGCRYVHLAMDNQGTHPGRDALLLWQFYRLLRHERPAVFLAYTVKPNVYGSLAAHSLSIPVINNISGLGAVFINSESGWLTRMVKVLYRLALSRSTKVFFQNKEDRGLFIEGRLVSSVVADLLPGSGVDLERFAPALTEKVRDRGSFRFLLVARLLWDKGVGEFVEAARILKQRYNHVEFCLLGFLDVQNPAAVPRAQVEKWVAEGVVNYLSATDDIRPFVFDADCVVLPSYREGTPRVLLEAAALAKPIVTTDTVGCREVVEDGENGVLCKLKDASDLAAKMEQILMLSHEERAEMGRKGRRKVVRQFDENIVIEKHITAINDILSKKK